MGKTGRDSSGFREDLRKEYLRLAPLAQQFATELVSQLNRLLEDRGITLGYPVQQRVKTWEATAEKLTRKKHSFSSLREMQDLVGLRVILLFKRDALLVHDLISDHFKVLRQYNTEERLKEDQFGYASMHYVVELPGEWLAVPTLAPFAEFQAEIQVRTMAQHMWAAASHVLQYKQETSVPTAVLRSIYRVSALLETVDLEFERVLTERASYRAGIDLSEPESTLNVDLLERILDELLPAQNKGLDEAYADLLQDLEHFGIETPAAVSRILEKHKRRVLRAEALRVQRERESMRELEDRGELYDLWDKDDLQRVRSGVFYTHSGLAREALVAEFGEAWMTYIMKKYRPKDSELPDADEDSSQQGGTG